MQRCRPPTRSAGSGQNRPPGVCTSTSSPGRTSRTSQREKSPSGISRTPTRGRSPAGAQIEYCRRSSRPSTCRRSVSDCPGTNAKSSARSAGTSKVTATASSVSSSTSATVRCGRRPSDLLHVLERLEAVRAAVERLARRRAVLGGQVGARRCALRAGDRPSRRHQGERDRSPGSRCGARRGQSVCAQGVAAALGDPVARPRGAQGDLDARQCTRRPRAGAPGRRASSPSPDNRSTSA